MKVTLYTTANCPGCFAAKRWLDKNNIQYTVVIGKVGERVYPTIEVIGDDGIPKYEYGWSRQVQRRLEKMLLGG